jgi:hypothetical protein
MNEAEKKQWAETLKSLPLEEAAEHFDLMKRMIDDSLQQRLPSLMRGLGYSEEIAGLVHLLAAKSGDAKEDVLRKALTLYGLALDAVEKGNRLAILNPQDEIVQEITGFEPSRPVAEPVAG